MGPMLQGPKEYVSLNEGGGMQGNAWALKAAIDLMKDDVIVPGARRSNRTLLC